MSITKYFDKNRNEVVRAAVLFNLRGFPRDEEKLRSINIFPIREEKPEFNWLEQKLVADEGLSFDLAKNEYVEVYRIKYLSDGEKKVMARMKQHQDDVVRRDEILTALKDVDTRGARSVRAIFAAQYDGVEPDEDDIRMIKSLEAEALVLRNELQEINARLKKEEHPEEEVPA